MICHYKNILFIYNSIAVTVPILCSAALLCASQYFKRGVLWIGITCVILVFCFNFDVMLVFFFYQREEGEGPL